MSDTKVSAESEANREEIERVDAAADHARGNVHSEKDEPIDQGAPPPMPN